jgi:hypothetical protein
MAVKPVLDDWEIPRIASIRTLEQRNFVEFRVPGRVGSLFQDMNSQPTRIEIMGSLYGEEARSDFLEQIRGKFRNGEPMTFVADIITATDIQYAIVETLEFEENGRNPDEIGYRIVLVESPPPPPPSDLLGGLDTSLLDQAGSFLDTVTGALDVIDALGNIPDFGDPTPQISGLIDGVQSAVGDPSALVSPLVELFGSDD